jgi:diguanylate cyclase (GGDEF)-like protein/PAS domain S-box-containing protein
LPDHLGLFRQIVEQLPQVVRVFDPTQTHLIYVSPGYERLWGRPLESLSQAPSSWLEMVHPDERDTVRLALLTRAPLGGYFQEYRITRPDGTVRWIRDWAFPLRDETKAVCQIVGIWEDITSRKQTELELSESRARLSSIASIAADAIIVIDNAQHIIFFNQAAEHVFGYLATEVLGHPIDLLLPERFVDLHRQHIRDFVAAPATDKLMGERAATISGRRKDGAEFPAEAAIAHFRRNGEVFCTVVIRDITEREQDRVRIDRLTHYSPVTGFPNRILVYNLIREAITAREDTATPLAVLLMDLDRFKEINDTLGHHRGDLLLQQVGSRLRSVLWEPDIVAHLGGDEFAILLPRLAAGSDVRIVVQKILSAFEAPFLVEELPIAVETSIGVALYPDHGATPELLLQRADVAMYAAKQSGGCVTYDAQHDRHSPRRLTLLGQLRSAIEQDQLRLHYQPKVDIATRRVTSVEALVRWQHPDHGLLPPDQFIAPAEQTGMIKPLTIWILNAALHQYTASCLAGAPLGMAINLSVRTLHDPNLPDRIAELLTSHRVPPAAITLEITESAIMVDPARAKNILGRLRAIGLRLSLDDFGTGYSSLGYLKDLPLDEIKIDKSFTQNICEQPNGAPIVRSIVDLGHSLGLHVVAEGIEDQQTWTVLAELGCDTAQGYYISRPQPAEALASWLRESLWGFGHGPERE